MIKPQEMVVLVDQQDQVVGLEEKMRAHELGLLHRAFSVFVFRAINNKTELLLQQRNLDKYHAAGLWTNTCCSHPRLNEDVITAGQRRLQEEMGFALPLTLVGNFQYRAEFSNGLVEHEYDHVLIGYYKDEIINCNPQEVHAYKWITLDDLERSLSCEPQTFTPWLKQALAIVKQHGV